MAKLIPWDELKKGTVYHEEWLLGTSTKPVYIVWKDERSARIIFDYKEKMDCYKVEKVNKSCEYRYWDSVPTDEEREFTRWGTAK